ncbi:MAG: uridine diphosphate-N-acetylglucosamine-binding protein YvcK [Candidatus Omnitrophica bacterium]|nr:uridine diphosphate-N-acetylglucosamine-binding protein YvcK [Candidatus Omnitrophota bacterium]
MARILVADPDPSFSQFLATLLKRFDDQVEWIRPGPEGLPRLTPGAVDLLLVNEPAGARRTLEAAAPYLQAGRPPVVLLGMPSTAGRVLEAYQRGIAYYVIKPFHPRELVSCVYALLHRQRRVVSLGGGTGLYTLLLGLKTLPNTHLTSIVSMSDDGGSTGRLREAFGILPPGDVRRSLVALSAAPALMKDLIQYRFPGGEGLKDHNLGNLLLAAVTQLTGSMAEAVRAMGDILNIQGIVLPVTTTLNTLVAEFEDGTVVRGERLIDVPQGRDPRLRIRRLRQEPETEANPNAMAAILAADVVTIGPGDLFTSVVATLTVKGIAEAIQASRARKIYVCNLMTKPGETSGFSVADHVREVVRYLGADVLHEILVSNTPLSQDAIRHYADKEQEPVRLDDEPVLRGVTKAQVVAGDITSAEELVRHESLKLAQKLARLFASAPAARPLSRVA